LEDWKIKISVLWIVLGIVGVWMPFSELYLPGYVEELISGFKEGSLITPEMILVFAIIMMIPLVMAVLSLTLKDKANRWANIIMGTVVAVLSLLDPIMYVAKQSAYSAYVILIGIVMVVFAALIVWYAWKSK
jgi:phosphoglycerol transferase MdoB-like AlkP superfamily enzyme